MRRRRSARLQAQDEKLLREVYQTCHYRLVSHLNDLLGNRAEAFDLSQEVLIRFYAALRRGRKVHSPRRFLMKVANRLAIRHLQKQRRRERSLFRPPEDLQDDLVLQEAWSIFKVVWPLLGPKEQLVAKCLLIDQMTLKEIVKTTELTRSSIQRKISKIQKLISEVAGEEDFLSSKVGNFV